MTDPTKAKRDYWAVRHEILRAVQNKDDAEIKRLAALYPDIFTGLVNQAKNASRRDHRWTH